MMNQIRIILLTTIAWSTIFPSTTAQDLRGMEMTHEIYGGEINLYAYAYRVGDAKDSIKVAWGDGLTEFIPRAYSISTDLDSVRLDYYYAEYEYSIDTGYIELTISDGPMVDYVANIAAPTSSIISITDSIWMDSTIPHSYYSFNTSSYPWNDQTEVFYENGALKHIVTTANIIELDSVSYEIIDFPSDEYAPPPGFETILIEDGFLKWAEPPVVGTFALAFRIREYRNVIGAPPKLMSTFTRAMMIDVDSSHIISSIPEIPKVDFRLFPNPATDYMQIEAAGLSGADNCTVELHGLKGRVVHTAQMAIPNGVLQASVPVHDLPTGVYVLHFRFGECVLTKKVFVE